MPRFDLRVASMVFALAAVVMAPTVARGDALDAIRQRGVLRWGADAEGGGPFVYPRDDDPTQVQGFEVELAELLATRLGVQAEFVQGPWDKLPDLLKLGQIDIVLNGYEWKPVWSERYAATIPYYVYELQVLVRRDDSRFQQLEDLGSPTTRGKTRIAVLGGSAAESFVRERFGNAVEVVIYEGNTDAMRAVELAIDGVDATVQDLPIVTFYERRFPQLSRLGLPVSPGYYVILAQHEDETLVCALNTAIVEAWQDGSIPAILNDPKYRMWNDTQQRRGLLTDDHGSFRPDLRDTGSEGDAPVPQAESRFLSILRRIPELLKGASVTVLLSITSMPLAVIGGLLIALGRLYGPRWLRPPLGWYVEIVRGTPLVLQLFVIFFLLPEFADMLGFEVSLPRVFAGILGLAVNYSAYESEIYRAGLQAIPRGQMEAALSLGMSRRMALRRIIVPQAVRLVIPPVMNDFIALFKDTAVCSVITIVDLSKVYYMQAQALDAKIELGIVTALLYLAMSYPLSLFVGRVERRLAEGRA